VEDFWEILFISGRAFAFRFAFPHGKGNLSAPAGRRGITPLPAARFLKPLSIKLKRKSFSVVIQRNTLLFIGIDLRIPPQQRHGQRVLYLPLYHPL